jgi:hypothetical protein
MERAEIAELFYNALINLNDLEKLEPGSYLFQYVILVREYIKHARIHALLRRTLGCKFPKAPAE